jgi:hypothetical protein
VKQGWAPAWKAGVYYNRIVDQKLAEKSGYRHARDFFSARFKDISQATLSQYGAVARAFSEPIASKYGVWRLGALLTYEKLAGQALKKHSGEPMRADEAALLQRLHQTLGDDHPIALTSRQGKEGEEVMKQFANEFAKGIEAWGKTLGTASGPKEPR